MKKFVMSGLIGLSLAASATSASAAWGSPAPLWFRHSNASPGAHFAHQARSNESFAHRSRKEKRADCQRSY